MVHGTLFLQGMTDLIPAFFERLGCQLLKVGDEPRRQVFLPNPGLKVADHPPGVGHGFRDDKPLGMGKGVVQVIDHPLDHVPVIGRPLEFQYKASSIPVEVRLKVPVRRPSEHGLGPFISPNPPFAFQFPIEEFGLGSRGYTGAHFEVAHPKDVHQAGTGFQGNS